MTYYVKTDNDGLIKSTVYQTDKKILDVCQIEYSKLLSIYDMRGLKCELPTAYTLGCG